jgi:hypothetical protein
MVAVAAVTPLLRPISIVGTLLLQLPLLPLPPPPTNGGIFVCLLPFVVQPSTLPARVGLPTSAK